MLSKFSVKKPFTILVMVVAIIILGFVSLSGMTTDLLPKMSLPYLLLPAEAYIPALIALLVTVTLIILVFNYYISVAKDYNFKQRFLEMFVISGSVAVISFLVGLVIKAWLGIDI